jgi:peptide/nickel transport system permease protein/oligopeptide transport system permease protein
MRTTDRAALGPFRLTLRRIRRDRWTLGAVCLLAFVVFCSFAGASIASAFVGHTAQDQYPYAVDDNFRPAGPWTRVPDTPYVSANQYGETIPPPKGTKKALLVLGADGALGRDELLRLLDGGRTSLEIGLLGAFVALLVGVPLGIVAGYFGGFTDTVVSRLTETIMAFPLILFLVFASVRLADSLTSIGWGSVVPDGVFLVGLLIGLFTWFYPARLVRAEMLTLRNAEYVAAAQSIGASEWRIIRRHLLPHALPGLIVWAAIAIAANILLEVGLSFVGVGVQAQTPTWGSMLSQVWGTIFAPGRYNATTYTTWQTILPTLAIFVTVAALNQISEGIRRALQPWSSR